MYYENRTTLKLPTVLYAQRIARIADGRSKPFGNTRLALGRAKIITPPFDVIRPHRKRL